MRDIGVVPDIVDSVILVWAPGLIDISFLFNAYKYGPIEAVVGAERGGVIFFCELWDQLIVSNLVYETLSSVLLGY